MRRQINISLAVTAWMVAGTAFASDFEVREHRFRHHSSNKYERLVLEFAGHGAPEANVTTNAGGEVAVEVKGATLVGAIPEASINESFVGKSKYLGPVAMSTEGAHDGFTVRAFLKSSDAKLDAFWLSSPMRLVIDAFPSDSPRAHGRNIASSKKASHSGGHHKTSHAKKSTGHICFPSSAKVGLRVSFLSPAAKTAKPGDIHIPLQSDRDAAEPEGVVCYPRSAEVKPNIDFSHLEEVVDDAHQGLNVPGAPANAWVNESPAGHPAASAPAPAAELPHSRQPSGRPLLPMNSLPAPPHGAEQAHAPAGVPPAGLLPPMPPVQGHSEPAQSATPPAGLLPPLNAH